MDLTLKIQKKKQIIVNLFIFFSLLPIFKVEVIPSLAYIDNNEAMFVLNLFLKILTIVILMIHLVFLFIRFLRAELFITPISKIYILILIYLFSITYFNGDIKVFFANTLKPTYLVVLFEVHNNRNFKEYDNLLKQAYYISLVLMVSNLFLMLYIPEGLYIDYNGHRGNWLYGNYMWAIYYYLILLFLSYYKYSVERNNSYFFLKMSAVFTLIMISVYISGSKTSLVSLALSSLSLLLLLLLSLIPFLRRKIWFYNSYTIFIGMGIVTFIIMDTYSNNSLLLFLSSLTGKSVTLTGRTDIWDLYMNNAKDFVFLGTGYQDPHLIKSIYGYSNMHNQYLDWIYIGGLVHLVLLSVMMKEHSHQRINYTKNQFTIDYLIETTIILALFINYLSESRTHTLPLIALIYVMYFTVEYEKKRKYEGLYM